MIEVTPEEFMRRQVEKMVSYHWAEAEALIAEALKEHRLEDLMLEVHWDGSPRVRVVTPEDRWLNWQSANHDGGAY